MRHGFVRFCHCLLAMIPWTVSGGDPSPTPPTGTNALPVLIGFSNVAAWASAPATPDTVTRVSPEISSPAPWNELVVSWNVQPAEGAALRIEAQAIFPDRVSAFHSLGTWSLDDRAPWPRTSPKDPGDADARVKTDTLSLRTPARAVRLRLTLAGDLARHPERLRWVTLSMTDTRSRPTPRPPNARVWGTTLDVPERSQIAHPEGEAWCSPTCVSMQLGWWAKVLNQASLDRAVPEVARAVNDPAWPGTGNWPFNTAFAGSLDGLIACAARLRDLREVEDLVEAGIPVALSVNAPALRGETGRENGHLILAVGFTPEGHLVANDPYARLEKGQRVRRTYLRPHVERAWDNSHRLAYLIAPADRRAALPIDWR